MTEPDSKAKMAVKQCVDCGAKPGRSGNLGLCGKCAYDQKAWVRLQKNLRQCYREHGFDKPRASHAVYVRVVRTFWSQQPPKRQQNIVAELIDQGLPSASNDPIETLVVVLTRVLLKSPRNYWPGTEPSRSIRTVRGGLPGLGRRP